VHVIQNSKIIAPKCRRNSCAALFDCQCFREMLVCYFSSHFLTVDSLLEANNICYLLSQAQCTLNTTGS